MDQHTGVGVLDKAVRVLDALGPGPATLAELIGRTQLPRATAHRLAVALEAHRLVARTADGRFALGPRMAPPADPLVMAAGPVLAALRDETGESAQLYARAGSGRRCIAVAERASGLRDTVPVGAVLPMTAGSAARALLAWEHEGSGESGADGFSAQDLAGVRAAGIAETVAEREPGLASVSAPVRQPDGRVVAAVSVSGPVERMTAGGTQSPGARFGSAVRAAAARLEAALC